MAAPSYTEDLSDITLAEDITGWAALGGGGAGLGAGADFSMQGTNCVDKQVTSAEKGQVFDFGSTITPGTNTHFYIWVFLATPGLAGTLANRGLGIVLGTATTAYNKFHVEGSDTYGAAGRVGKCYPIRYVTTSNGSPPYRTLTGTPGANPQFFGATANITAAVKGANLGVDAMRYGTGAYITAGEVADPATFSGFATLNDTSTNRWGILTSVGGAFELQGRFVVGQDNTGTPALAYFSDSNKLITVVDTVHSLPDFTQIIVDHASTVFNLTNITVLALGTNNPGRLVFNNASTTSALTGCTFDKIGISTLRAGVTATNCTWRQTGQITLNGATLTGCTVSNNTAASAVVAADTVGAALVSNCDFTSDGTGHGLEIGGTAANMTLTNCTWTGYTAASGGNEAVYINIGGGSMTLTISGGTTPSVRTAGCTVTVETASRTVKVAVTKVGGVVTGANVFLAAADGGPFPSGADPDDIVTISSSGTTATVSHTAHGMANNDQINIDGITNKIEDNNGVHTITWLSANSYSYTTTDTGPTDYTGTIKVTFVFLKGEATAGTGGNEISMSRSIPSSQPVVGWARKSTEAPYYKEGAISGTVSSTGDTTFSPVLIDD